jgi:carbonic anhydrase/acetyltransferase-like protein (isoleucine patch superfamily)
MAEGETIIGDNVTIAHGSVLHNCTVRDGAIIGLNAVLLDFCEIGEQAMIAAGSVVTDNMKIPARHLAAGSPAKIKKEIAGASLMWVETSATYYKEMAQSYLEQGIGQVD